MSAELAIKPEFYQGYEDQRYHDLTTRLAEIVDGVMHAEFELTLVGDDLISADGRSMDKVTSNAQQEIDEIAKTNPILAFVDKPRRGNERDEFLDLVIMAKGEGPNTMVVESEFPLELWDAETDIGGYNVTRKQTMQRIFIRKEKGLLLMLIGTLDRSDRTASEAIFHHLNYPVEGGSLLGQRIRLDLDSDRQDSLRDELTAVYDQSLRDRFGGEWYAGRTPADYRNTYDFVCAQQDIIQECLRLDRYGWLNDEAMYDMAATMNKRFKDGPLANQGADLYHESRQAGAEARAMGMTFSACGGTIGANSFEVAGYGNAGEDQYGSLIFQCSKGHGNIRPRGQLIDSCQVCGVNVKC